MMLTQGVLGAAVVSAALLVTGWALAQPNPAQKATAEALFQQGSELMAADKIREACDKFAASYEIDPALGSALHLADCFDRIDKTASAWALFQEAESMAKLKGQTEREKIAHARALDLAQRLSRVQLVIDTKNAASKLEIRVNGVVIPRTSWDAPLPADPGKVRLAAAAPGRVSWSIELALAKGPTLRRVTVPALAAAPEKPASTSRPLDPSREPATAGAGSSQRTLGWISGGTGAAVLLSAGVLAYMADRKNRDSLEHCRVSQPNACTREGAELRDDAQTLASAATVTTVVGGALLVTGAALVFAAPSSNESRSRPKLRVARAAFVPALHERAGGVRLEGTW